MNLFPNAYTSYVHTILESIIRCLEKCTYFNLKTLSLENSNQHLSHQQVIIFAGGGSCSMLTAAHQSGCWLLNIGVTMAIS